MTSLTRYEIILDYFRRTMPTTKSELEYGNLYELIVSVVLSAQCTDKRVNMVTPALFGRYPTPQAMAAATEEDLLEYIRSVSYPNAKARHLAALARKLCDDFGGEVPEGMDKLLTLPGVGRKTANVVRAFGFGLPSMPVDTHVFRVAHRLGLVPEKADTPEKVEHELCRHIPEADIPNAHHWLLLHGRYTCTARKPKCEECELQQACKTFQKTTKRRSAQ